jgi:hypothetical protein
MSHDRMRPFNLKHNLADARASIKDAQGRLNDILEDGQVTRGNFMYSQVVNLKNALDALRPDFDDASDCAHNHCEALKKIWSQSR